LIGKPVLRIGSPSLLRVCPAGAAVRDSWWGLPLNPPA